jgi:hypothetical protein
MVRLNDNRIEPDRCRHGKIKVWRNKKRGCQECEVEAAAFADKLDIGGFATAEADDRGNLRKHRTARFHLGKER